MGKFKLKKGSRLEVMNGVAKNDRWWFDQKTT